MHGRRETCWCGHDRATHYADEYEMRDGKIVSTLRGACLGARCDCRWYSHDAVPEADTTRRDRNGEQPRRGKAQAVAPPPFHRWPLSPAQVPPPAPSSSGPSWSTIPPAPDTEPLP